MLCSVYFSIQTMFRTLGIVITAVVYFLRSQFLLKRYTRLVMLSNNKQLPILAIPDLASNRSYQTVSNITVKKRRTTTYRVSHQHAKPHKKPQSQSPPLSHGGKSYSACGKHRQTAKSPVSRPGPCMLSCTCPGLGQWRRRACCPLYCRSPGLLSFGMLRLLWALLWRRGGLGGVSLGLRRSSEI